MLGPPKTFAKSLRCRFSGLFFRFPPVPEDLRKPLQKPPVQTISRDFVPNCPRRPFFRLPSGTQGPPKTLAKTVRAADFLGFCAELTTDTNFQVSTWCLGPPKTLAKTYRAADFPGFSGELPTEVIFQHVLEPPDVENTCFGASRRRKYVFQSCQTSKIHVFELVDIEITCKTL